ncbi:MAG TPA: GNAT family N-acetyltransferase [Acidimicrobiales bacterium]|nr:GNAT family N-acetyltransferase [Acidimicrobiales bacterium]
MAPLVREAQTADAAEIAMAHIRSWQVGYAGIISGDFLRDLDLDLPRRTTRWQTLILGAEAEGSFVLVGEAEGEVAGWLSGGPCRGEGSEESALGEVYGCYVDPERWRQGVGSALMLAGLERLAGAGYSQAVLWVLADNSRARAFYERHGWRADGASKLFEVAGENHPEVRYRRRLP